MPDDLPKFYLNPGQFRLSMEPEIIFTILGSCVAIVMYSYKKNICAVSHCILPDSQTFNNNKNNDAIYKYVNSSIPEMISALQKVKVEKEEIKVKLFGGAEQTTIGRNNTTSVGKMNILKAVNLLKEQGLQIVSSDVGGNQGRKILISTQTGDVHLSRLGIFGDIKHG